jgi:ribosomal protein S18 acetylase RimI-like enzyme
LPLNYPHAFFLQLLTVPNRTCLIAHTPSQPSSPIGFVSASLALHPSPNKSLSLLRSTTIPSLDLNKPRLEILTLGVLPAYQNRGLARLLITRVVKHFRESCAPNVIDGALVHANVSISNLPAIKFYERIGMTVSSLIIRNLYTPLSTGSRDAYLVVGFF